MLLLLQVAGNLDRFPPGFFDPLDRFVRVLLFVGEIGDQDIRPFARKGDSNGSSNATIPAGNDGGSPREAA